MTREEEVSKMEIAPKQITVILVFRILKWGGDEKRGGGKSQKGERKYNTFKF